MILIAVLAAMEFYTRTPDDFAVGPLALPADTTTVTLVFHGSEDADNPVFAAIAAAHRERAGPRERVVNYRWAPAADNRPRAAANARLLGRTLGSELARLPALRSVRLIAHSSGAFVPDALCERLRAAADRPVRVTSVYLDPFGISGFVDWGYGAREHGRCADVAFALVNTDDPAPATNAPLARARTLDVTDRPGKTNIGRNGHYWPPVVYLQMLEAGTLEDALSGAAP